MRLHTRPRPVIARPPTWEVRQAGTVIYSGERGVQALAHMVDDNAREVPLVIVNHNGHRVWPPVEELYLG